MRINVTAVVASESERVLFQGENLDTGKQVQFHLRRDAEGHVDNIETAVERGNEIQVEL